MVELTKENFDAQVTNAEGMVLVDFWSPGCGPCRAMESVLEAAAARHPEVRFAKLNAADYPDIAWAFKVVSVPTLVLFRGGVPVDDIVGAVPAQRIEELLVESGAKGEEPDGQKGRGAPQIANRARAGEPRDGLLARAQGGEPPGEDPGSARSRA